ncbi:glutamate decarboxylase [Rhodotorula toruloides]|uniref:Glutamate decarboxylase n=1 Tax=Rhodotorula toruloides TaxID=5286 RepID=A0A2T0A260_RHOTO|nr:glutamate decarboxylase [Rhodotorula toruloides]
MSLSRHLNPDRVIQEAREHSKKHRGGRETIHDMLNRGEASGHLHGSHKGHANYDTDPIPKYRIPSKGTDAKTAYDLVNSELLLDGNPQLNLASFVHTQMSEYADRIMFENRMKNQIDSDEYPGTTLIHNRLVSMIASLWHADDKKEDATGCVTTGSSEAAQLGGLAMKKMWQARRKAAGKSWKEPGPNIVLGSNAQVALEKFARYFDVEARFVDVDESTKYVMDPKRAVELVDENTIGVYVILGSTYTGTYENVEEMSRLLDEYEAKTGHYVPIHVDAASGGFVAPFASPSLKWDFRIPRVVSINSSGHKFGQSYVGCGFIVWRDKQHLPKELVFELHYLGSVEYSFSLNFSRPAAPFLAQYFNLLYLGFEGYRRVALNDLKNARLLARALERSKYYKVVSEVHHLKDRSLTEKAKETVGAVDDVEAYVPSLPVVAFMFSDEFRKEYPRIKQRSIQLGLREHNWIVPNYDLPPNAQDKEVLRVVIRENFNEDMVERLFHDIIEVTEQLMDEHKADVRQPGEGEGRNVNAPKHGKGKEQSVSERMAASHGEGTRPVGHDSVC